MALKDLGVLSFLKIVAVVYVALVPAGVWIKGEIRSQITSLELKHAKEYAPVTDVVRKNELEAVKEELGRQRWAIESLRRWLEAELPRMANKLQSSTPNPWGNSRVDPWAGGSR